MVFSLRQWRNKVGLDSLVFSHRRLISQCTSRCQDFPRQGMLNHSNNSRIIRKTSSAQHCWRANQQPTNQRKPSGDIWVCCPWVGQQQLVEKSTEKLLVRIELKKKVQRFRFSCPTTADDHHYRETGRRWCVYVHHKNIVELLVAASAENIS